MVLDHLKIGVKKAKDPIKRATDWEQNKWREGKTTSIE
jgi:hypothetical protein